MTNKRSSFSLGIILFISVLTCAQELGSRDGVWTLLAEEELNNRAPISVSEWVRPDKYQAVQLNASHISTLLQNAPAEFRNAETLNLLLLLPTPNGGFEEFKMVLSPVMAPELAQWMEDQGWPMQTYKGQSTLNPATQVRLDWGGPAGFHASITSPGASYYIDPYWQGDTALYVSYFKKDLAPKDKNFSCDVFEEALKPPAPRSGPGTNGNLRTYRLACAATGEYTAFHGGSQADGLAAVTTTINRVNQIYERDLALRMILVANNQDLIFTNGNSDPYTNNDGVAMLSQNQSTVDSVIGDSNYDIGHVVSTNGGGVASLGVPCVSFWKARGVTGTPNPIGDPFDIDYVAHEMGHQWGGNHTFNSPLGACSGGNRNAFTAYEPGSGATIQAYAGICNVDNLQSNSDAYFHGISLDEMLGYIASSGTCSVNISATNPNAPTVNAGSNYTIPVSTPFELDVASSGDADGDTLTYTWEEFDLGPALSLASPDNGSSPIFRSWHPSTASTRVFPRLSNLLVGNTPIGERLPTTNRTMTFRVTVRDNNSGGGRIDDDSMTVTSSTAAGPFLVIAPNGGETLNAGSQNITWNVANTDSGAVNTSHVNILLSTDGGTTYPTVLLADTPNDGSQIVTIPSLPTTTARIKIKGSSNIFFDISNQNFTLLEACNPPNQPGPVSGLPTVCAGQTGVTYSIDSVTAATGYTWTTPTGSLITNNTGTSITVTFGSTEGEITVTADNACGSSTASTLAVSFTPLPSQPLSISGNDIVCSGQTGVAYSIIAVSGATGYSWSVPPGASISTNNGTSIEVTFGASEGSVGVTADNDCGSSPPQTKAVTFTTLSSQPGTITGNGTACMMQAGVSYSISTVPNATGYTWSVPAGSSITGNSGTSITVTFGTTDGDIGVTADNACGSSSLQTLAVTLIPPPDQPGPITGDTIVCTGQTGVVYTIDPVAGATGYTWSVPLGSNIDVDNGTNLTVTIGDLAGDISVTADDCGPSAASTLAFTFSELMTTTTQSDIIQGADDITLETTTNCGTPPITVEWTILTGPDAGTSFGIDQNPVILNNPRPEQTTDYQSVVIDQASRTTVTATITVMAAALQYHDVNGDGCNNVKDLLALYEFWRDLYPGGDDPSMDGLFDVRDFMLISTDDPLSCTGP